MTSLLASVLLLQAASQPAVLPQVRPGTSSALQEAVRSVKTALIEGKFDEASKLISHLPKTDIKFSWDDSAVPSARRTAFAAARDRALDVWKQDTNGLTFKEVKSGADVKFSFTDVLPKSSEGNFVQGAVFMTSFIPGEPKVDAVIGLKRSDPLRQIETMHVSMEVMFAIGASLGLERMPKPGGAMGRTDTLLMLPPSISPGESIGVREVLSVVQKLSALAAARKPVKAEAAPVAYIDVKKLNAGEALQYGPMQMSFQVTNQGTAPLIFNVVPDCSCFSVTYTGTVAPGATNLVKLDVNTGLFPGPLHKSIFVYSNDPDKSVTRIDVQGNVIPIYRFLRTDNNAAVVIPPTGKKVTVFLAMPEDRPFLVLKAAVAGIKGDVSYEPWEGVLADPEFDDPAKSRQGYKFVLDLKPGQFTGRFPITLECLTNDKVLKSLNYTLYVQSGIIASPARIFLGEVLQKTEVRAFTVISRPGQPFKITKLVSDSEFVKVTQETLENGDIKVTATIDGRQPIGVFKASITAVTDDAKQPKIPIEIQGVVK